MVVIEVDDTIAALQALAQAVRRASGAKVVAITGSAGKTTTKEVTAEFLAARYRVIRNRGNFNNHIGLPLSLIELRQRPEIAVVELGMNHAGEISTLVRVAEPDVRVWTNVGEAHLGFFQSVDAIADAKAEIFEGATPATVLVANADDDRIVRRMPRFAGRVVTFGIDRDADVRATAVRSRGIDGTDAHVATPSGAFDLSTPLIGRGNLANVLAATAVAIEFDVSLPDIAERAGRLAPASRRGEVLRLAKRNHGHRRQLQRESDGHQARARGARRCHGPIATRGRARRDARAGRAGRGAPRRRRPGGGPGEGRRADRRRRRAGQGAGGRGRCGLACRARRSFTSRRATRPRTLAATLVQRGDLVLVKGSRGVRTDRVVDRLKAEFA